MHKRNKDNAQDIDIVMPMYNLIEYSDNYSKTSGSLWQYYKDDPNNNIENSESFKYKTKITGKTPNIGNRKDFFSIEMIIYTLNIKTIVTWHRDFYGCYRYKKKDITKRKH